MNEKDTSPGGLIGVLRRRFIGDHDPSVPPADGLPDEVKPERRLQRRALRELAGFERGLLYDVPYAQAPRPRTVVYVDGSPAWRRYLAAREQFDDGRLTMLLALRPLGAVERTLVVDWGTTYANTFLLVEPRDQTCDLTDGANPVQRRLDEMARALLRCHALDEDAAEPWTRRTPLGEALRQIFGVWVFWSAPLPHGRIRRVPLTLLTPNDTLAGRLLPALRAEFSQERFDAALAVLVERERELFRRSVACARIPFRTRLGLPMLHDPYCVDRAIRRLVNEGRLTVRDGAAGGALYRGPERPVPDAMTDAEFERLLL
jgi:hypothetical protein